MQYDHLAVTDATGRQLAARMAAGDELRLVVEDTGTQYPVTIDPAFTQQAYLKASNTQANDRFGLSVAMSGDTAVVGAIFENSSATGVNGDQTNNSATDAGAAYVFVTTPDINVKGNSTTIASGDTTPSAADNRAPGSPSPAALLTRWFARGRAAPRRARYN